MTVPTPPTPVDGDVAAVTDRLGGHRVAAAGALLEHLAASGAEVRIEDGDRVEAGRDWWPLAIAWAARGQVPARPAAIVRPSTTEQVAAVLAGCATAGVPVTPAAGRSGVCGGSVPVFGGVALDCTGLVGEVTVDETSLVAEVPAGTFGPDLEAALARIGDGYTLGHWPQSMDLSTVGGWLACRGAGQYSTRYGKIEDLVVGLEVVLADGRVVLTEGRAPRAATGPSLTQLFVGSEGTLGVITRAWFRVRPRPPAEGRRAFGFDRFADGLDACRRILRRGATPAVLRLYDRVESQRSFERDDTCVLVVLDEADPGLLDATLAVVDDECAAGGASGTSAERLPDDLVDRWLAHRNDVTALAPLWRADVVVDTVEIAGRWAALAGLADDVVAALTRVPGTLVASVHQSHAYTDGACLYFTFAGRRPDGDPGGDSGLAWEEAYYRRAWDVVTTTVLRAGAAISHHHGIGLNRSRFVEDAPRHRFRGARRGQAGPRPDRHPQPRQARPAVALRRPRLAVSPAGTGGSLLVVDVGTSGVRAAIVRPDATVTHVHHRAVLPVSPAPGLVEVDAAAIASAVVDVAGAALADGGPVAGVGIANQRATTVVWERATGRPVAPALGWQDLRTVGTCLALQADGLRLAPNMSATKLAAILDEVDPDRSLADAGALCFGTIDTWVAWTLAGGAAGSAAPRDRSDERRSHRARPAGHRSLGGRWADRCWSGWLGVGRPCPRRPPYPDGCPARDRRLVRADRRRRGPGAVADDLRHRRRPAGVAGRPGLYPGRPGQGDVRHRRDARPVHRTATADDPRPGPGRDVPDRRLAAGRRTGVGSRGRHALGRHLRRVAA